MFMRPARPHLTPRGRVGRMRASHTNQSHAIYPRRQQASGYFPQQTQRYSYEHHARKRPLLGKTHTTPTRRAGANPANHGVDLHLTAPGAEAIAFEDAAPHPTAEQLFAGAWSACYITAIGLVAMQKKV